MKRSSIYANRANILADLMKSGYGSNMVRAISKMFRTSTHCPKFSTNRLGDGINSDLWCYLRSTFFRSPFFFQYV